MSNNQRFKDLDLHFIPHPSTGDVVKVVDDAAIKQSVKNLIQYNFYEKWNPRVGSGVYGMLFEQMTIVTASALQRAIEQTIRNFEPRVELITTKVSTDIENQSYVVKIAFNLVNLERPIELDFVLKRVR